VNVHLLPQIATPFSDIDELAGELEAVADVVGAAAPLPVAQAWHSNRDLWRPRLVTVVTRARLDATLAARPGYRVRHPRTHDGVDERRFSATCKNQGHIHLTEMFVLTLNPLMWRIWWAPNNARRWQVGFNWAFKRLKERICSSKSLTHYACGHRNLSLGCFPVIAKLHRQKFILHIKAAWEINNKEENNNIFVQVGELVKFSQLFFF